MSFPILVFPMTVDFCSGGYWIGDIGPYKHGAATTALLRGDDLTDDADETKSLTEQMEELLQTFGSHLSPYAVGRPVSAELFLWPEKAAANCSVCFAFHPVEGSAGVMAERWSISCLRDFLYIELGKAIQRGNAPRQCRLCGKWFLHEQGDKTVYCNRIAPGETEKTCREVGARAVFEKKIQEEDTWKIYKRAYKKYYARFMKGNMSREEFNAWGEQAAERRDLAIALLRQADSEEERAQIIETMREDLNRL